MPLVATRGAASAQGFGEFAQSAAPVYIEDVFSTWLYTGNGSTQTITNGIDLSTYDGLVWCKNRAQVSSHELSITRSDLPLILRSNATDASQQGDISGFHSAGFFLQNVVGNINQNNQPCVSWTFREQPKFFDVVTYTGDGTTSKIINHNLGSVPGCIIVKPVTLTGGWLTYHRSLGNTKGLYLNTTAASATSSGFWNNTDPTSTQFTVGSTSNDSGQTFVAYLFAHDAGGFGLTNTDNVISCGSYTGNGSASGPTVTLGYEPQWVLIKKATGTADNWILFDNMRGMPVGAASDSWLFPNSSAAEATGNTFIAPTATGFYLESSNSLVNQSAQTYIYIAIRRGPMKTPTSGTSVFAMDTQGSTTPRPPSYKSGFPVDWAYTKDKGTVGDWFVGSRLTGTNYLSFNLTSSEATSSSYKFDYQNGWLNSTAIDSNRQSWMLQRAPGFFDVVCYTGTGSNRTVSHNLGVAPEMMIVKSRDTASNWAVYSSGLANTEYLLLNLTNAKATGTTYWNSTTPTSSVFSVGTDVRVNNASTNYVAYLFASCPGVSKVGTYNGNGGTQQINCGFTSGARFVLIKATNGSSDWVVFDSARGMTTSTDPYLYLNSSAAEGMSGSNAITQTSAGFEITDVMGYNASGFTYIYLAIA